MNKYLIIGEGRLASHFEHYLSLLGLHTLHWSRQANNGNHEQLRELFEKADRALLLISDSSILSFLNQNSFLVAPKTIHCSGALTLGQIDSAHPLMTFGRDLYDLEVYVNIPFVTEAKRRPFSTLLPELSNPSFEINSEKKSLYHALCSMSGNFTTLLWEQTFNHFESELKLPGSVLLPYMNQIFQNLKSAQDKNESESVLTGPLARGDVKTIVQHLDALAGRPEQNLYYAFVNYYLKQKNKIGELEYEHIRL